MDNLVRYLYKKFVTSDDPVIEALSKNQSLSLVNVPQAELSTYYPVIARNILVYSHSSMQLKISLPNLFAYQRLHKIQKIMEKEGYSDFFRAWVESQMLPFLINSKKKFVQNPYAYIDHQCEEKQKNSKALYMLNIPELTKRLICQNLRNIFGNQKINLENEAEYLKNLERAKWMKFQEFIAHKMGSDTLMVLNFLLKYPFLEEKELLKKTMLKVADLRKSLNLLLGEGLIHFYHESARIIVYKCIKPEKMLEILKNELGSTILNHYIRLESEQNAEKRMKLLVGINQLDDILILF